MMLKSATAHRKARVIHPPHPTHAAQSTRATATLARGETLSAKCSQFPPAPRIEGKVVYSDVPSLVFQGELDDPLATPDTSCVEQIPPLAF
jgi:hypothetical protein